MCFKQIGTQNVRGGRNVILLWLILNILGTAGRNVLIRGRRFICRLCARVMMMLLIQLGLLVNGENYP